MDQPEKRIAEKTYEQWVEEISPFIMAPGLKDEINRDLSLVLCILDEPYRAVAEAFQHNVETVVASAMIPLTLALASAKHSSLQRFVIAEQIRARGWDDLSAEEKQARIEANAKANLKAESASKDGSLRQAKIAMNFLATMLKDAGMKRTGEQLLEQGVVSAWSAFEVLCRDLFECHVNLNPSLALALDKDDRKRFEVEHVSLKLLAEHSFDLSGKIGSIMVQQHDFSDLGKIRSLYARLFPDDDALQRALKSSELRLLYKRRNLFVHRRGFADKRYVDETGEKVEIGSRLVIEPVQLREMILRVANTGMAILRQVWRRQSDCPAEP